MFKLITAFFACSDNKPRLERASEADGGGDKRVEPEIFQDEAGKELLRFKRITEELPIAGSGSRKNRSRSDKPSNRDRIRSRRPDPGTGTGTRNQNARYGF